MTVRHANMDGFGSLAMVGLCMIWAWAQVAIKVADQGIEPVFQAGLRSALAGCLVFAWCRWRGVALFERDRTLVPGLILGVLFASEYSLVFFAYDYTTVSRAVIIFHTMPLFVAVGAHFLVPGERLTWLRIAGLVAAFVGVAAIFSDGLSLSPSGGVFGDVLMLLAAVAWAANTLVVKTTKLSSVLPEKVLLYQLSISGALLLAAAPFFRPLLHELSALAVASFAYEVVVVVSFSYIAWFTLIQRYPASQLSTFTFLTPVFAVLIGILVLGEPPSLNLVIGTLLTTFGIIAVTRRSRQRTPRAGADELQT